LAQQQAFKMAMLTGTAHFLGSAHPEMANFPDIFVARKILSSEDQPYACGKIFRPS
jgi:hypothetical protein